MSRMDIIGANGNDGLHYDVYPWKEPIYECESYWVYNDKYPVTEGHLLFVPKNECRGYITLCFDAALKLGKEKVETKEWDGFNIGINQGKAAGQTVPYPHIHLIPRRNGDMEDPTGGVRHVIPNKGNYKNGQK